MEAALPAAAEEELPSALWQNGSQKGVNRLLTKGREAAKAEPESAPEKARRKKKKRTPTFSPKQNGPSCAQPLSSAEFWGYQATASREKVWFEVRRVRSKPETPKQVATR